MQYGPKKHLETLFKSLSFPQNELSAVPPYQYADRFVKFIRAHVHSKDETKATTAPAAVHLPNEDLSRVSTVPEEDTPSRTTLAKSPSGESEIGRAEVHATREQTLPAIRIEHPSPPIGEVGFEIPKGVTVVNGVQEKGRINGVMGDYLETEREKRSGVHV